MSDAFSGETPSETEMLIEPTLNAIMPVGENLHLIAGGKYPPNPSELLMSSNFTQLLDKVSVQYQYDVVIIDTPPVLAVTDAAIIGEQCGTRFMGGTHRTQSGQGD